MTEQSDRTFIYDTRHVAPQRTTLLTGITHRVHRALDSAARLPTVVTTVNADGGESVDAATVQAALEELIDRKLVLRFGDRYLALAVRGEVPVLPKRNEDGYPGGWIERRSELPTLESQVAWAKPSPATVHQVAQQHSLSPKSLASKSH
jgi:magnesium-protoporphyrin IX monomethyl ester (oxidative) cyclase